MGENQKNLRGGKGGLGLWRTEDHLKYGSSDALHLGVLLLLFSKTEFLYVALALLVFIL